MSGRVADVLIDTDIFVDHLRGAAALKAGRHRLHYSVITRAELFAGSSAADVIAQLLGPLREVVVDRGHRRAGGACTSRDRDPPTRCPHRGYSPRAEARGRDPQCPRLQPSTGSTAAHPELTNFLPDAASTTHAYVPFCA